MKNNWTLTVKTSLPNVCVDDADLTTSITSFENFETAKDTMRETIANFVFSDNAMFDGYGNMKKFTAYIKEAKQAEEKVDCLESYDTNWLSSYTLIRIHECLHRALIGDSIKLEFPHIYYQDSNISVTIKPDFLELHGFGNGIVNGVNPRIRTNIFDMSREKNYMLYIDDLFVDRSNRGISTKLYIDLVKK